MTRHSSKINGCAFVNGNQTLTYPQKSLDNSWLLGSFLFSSQNSSNTLSHLIFQHRWLLRQRGIGYSLDSTKSLIANGGVSFGGANNGLDRQIKRSSQRTIFMVTQYRNAAHKSNLSRSRMSHTSVTLLPFLTFLLLLSKYLILLYNNNNNNNYLIIYRDCETLLATKRQCDKRGLGMKVRVISCDSIFVTPGSTLFCYCDDLSFFVVRKNAFFG